TTIPEVLWAHPIREPRAVWATRALDRLRSHLGDGPAGTSIGSGARRCPHRRLSARVFALERGDMFGRVHVVAHAHDLLLVVEGPQVQLLVSVAAAIWRRKLDDHFGCHLAVTG